MAPPMQLSAWANAYSAIFARATNVGFWRDLLRTGGWVGLGVAVSLHTYDHCPC
jgi:F-type H+-transporting ATPase subunit g